MVRGVMTLQIPRANTSSIRPFLLPALLLAMCSFVNADSRVLADLVAAATASLKDGGPELFVKLEGVNYTGSTYQLALRADKNKLEGKYFQSTQKQTYEIFFERQPEKKGETEPAAR